MKQLEKFKKQIRLHLLVLFLLFGIILIAAWWIDSHVEHLLPEWTLVELGLITVLLSTVIAILSSRYITKPLRLLYQAIEHISPNSTQVASPNIGSTQLGHELITTMMMQIYSLATATDSITTKLKQSAADFHTNSVASNLPLPMFIIDRQQNIIFANFAALKILGLSEEDVINENVYSVLDMSFETDETLDKWLQTSRANTVTDTKTWDRVRLTLNNTSKILQFDLAAFFNKSSTNGYEVLLVLFDHTIKYSREDEGLSFIALAVHELRTPLTLLRGYIEAIEEDLGTNLPPSDAEFLHRMDAAGQKLATFMNNVLNVARIEDDQFVVHLGEENWTSIVQSAVNDMTLRSNIVGIQIVTEIAPDLPTAGADKVSVYEVISNLIDNAIKYSGKSKKIVVRSTLTKDGLIETDVQDFGIGIPQAIVPNLFDKFYRNHRTRQQIGGTGLGLYLSKAIVDAHGGNIWVRSIEGEGSTFSFTIMPYQKLSSETKNQQADLTRTAHGWIKNHSLYRR
ncbi:MAG TPA: ATP-binding protein [Candidatus Saccharimonadales bacterium]|nr:ATP-binding protein [Candidatus Saccharimonadales bacterium]